MGWVLALALLVPQDSSRPARFELTVLQDLETGEARGYLVGDTPFHLRIRALGKDGRPLASFAGTVEIEGLVRLDRERKETPVAAAGPFEGGEFALENVHLRGGAVTVRCGDASTRWAPRVLPGWLSIVPPLLAIALAIATRQVLVALLAGIVAGALFIHDYNPLAALLRTFDTYLVRSLADPANAAILVFTVALGGMVGIVSRSGGTKALVLALSRRARSRRTGMLSTWLMGIVIFFDDYANCLLVGNTVRPYSDSLRIPREKLSFIVDSTAAPVAVLAIVSTWIGYELGQIANTGVIPPAEAYGAFLASLPYRFYCFLLLIFVFAVAVTGRDFGPMLRAERRAVETGRVLREGAQPLMDRELTEIRVPEDSKLRWWNAGIPVLAVIAIVLGGLYTDGRVKAGDRIAEIDAAVEAGAMDAGEAAAERASLGTLRGIISKADSYAVLCWASFGGSLVALALVLLSGTLTLTESLEAWVTGCKSMVIAVLILTLAWGLGGICRQHLQTGPWVISLVSPPAHFLPVIVFLASCLIAFATGTSYGTMAIVFPIAGPMAWAMTGDASGLDPAVVHSIRYATIGAVLTGAVFGDHCSPISDTTVMSSMAAASDHLDHVRTQMPYALVCGAVAAVVGYVPAGFGFPAWGSVLLGAALLVGALFLLGRRAEAAPPPAGDGTGRGSA